MNFRALVLASTGSLQADSFALESTVWPIQACKNSLKRSQLQGAPLNFNNDSQTQSPRPISSPSSISTRVAEVARARAFPCAFGFATPAVKGRGAPARDSQITVEAMLQGHLWLSLMLVLHCCRHDRALAIKLYLFCLWKLWTFILRGQFRGVQFSDVQRSSSGNWDQNRRSVHHN